MPNQITGKILVIGQKETITGANGSLEKREVVLNCSRRVDQWSDEWIENFPKFEFTGKFVDEPVRFNVGDVVTVSFGLQGRKVTSNGQERYFTNVLGFKMEPYHRQNNQQQTQQQPQGAPAASAPAPATAPAGEQTDDLPF